jgi:hypothetical protein
MDHEGRVDENPLRTKLRLELTSPTSMELTKEYFDEQLKRLASKGDLDEISQRVTAIDQRVDNLTRFLDQNMVTREEFAFQILRMKKDPQNLLRAFRTGKFCV